jgi:hypothetical protein
MKTKSNVMSVGAACLLLSLAEAQQKEVTYGFAGERYVIEMTVAFSDPYLGRRLVFYTSANPQQELCYSGDRGGSLGRCPERFVGAVATVRFSVRHRNGNPLGQTTIREHVTVVAQSHGLPGRPPFSKTIELANGIGSDLQVFGYDEADVKESDRIRMRHKARQTMWRLYRQTLYVDSEPNPFAIVEWKHTVDRISVLQIYSPNSAQ